MAITHIELTNAAWTQLTNLATQVRISSCRSHFKVAAAASQPTSDAPAWVNNTDYKVGDKVTNWQENVYTCTTAGKSAKNGVGPTGTGTGIIDGTVVWNYTAVTTPYEVVFLGAPGYTYTSSVPLWGMAL